MLSLISAWKSSVIFQKRRWFHSWLNVLFVEVKRSHVVFLFLREESVFISAVEWTHPLKEKNLNVSCSNCSCFGFQVIVCYWSVISSPAVVSSCADHVSVFVGEADVGHVRRVAEVALVFGLQTEKILTFLFNKQTINYLCYCRSKGAVMLAGYTSPRFYPTTQKIYISLSKLLLFNVSKFSPTLLMNSSHGHSVVYQLFSAVIDSNHPTLLYKNENVGDSQTSLCRGSRTVWPIQSRRRWQCSGRRETHTRSWLQLCLRFAAIFPTLHLPGCCGREETGSVDSKQLNTAHFSYFRKFYFYSCRTIKQLEADRVRQH